MGLIGVAQQARAGEVHLGVRLSSKGSVVTSQLHHRHPGPGKMEVSLPWAPSAQALI